MRTTTKILIGMGGGPPLLAILVLAVAFSACPHNPPPTPVNPPDASDAAMDTRRPPAPVTCSVACRHAASACPASKLPCPGICDRVSTNDPHYPVCVAAASDCPALKACDPGSGKNSGRAAGPRGR